MAHAYTPGLRVAPHTMLRKTRRLPLPGEVVVKEGQAVQSETIVAKTALPGNVQTVNIANVLGIPPADVSETLQVKVGTHLKKGDVIAENKSFFGLFKSQCRSTVDATLEGVSEVTGQATLREAPIPVEIDAYVESRVVEVIPREGVVVETEGAFIQGIFGIGGETVGTLVPLVKSADEELDPSKVKGDLKGAIVIGGSYVTEPTLQALIKAGAHGVVVGGFDDQDLRKFLGYDLGVAITGAEEKGITLVVTEGFGKMKMANRTFDLLVKCAGKKASINGATQIRAGVLRPEVIVPGDHGRTASAGQKLEEGLTVGSPVRVIREPNFGRLGTVSDLPPELQPLETEAHVRVLKVRFDDGSEAVVPRANVEMIES